MNRQSWKNRNQAFAGTVQIELGGLTPGSGPNNHDQVVDLSTAVLVDGATLEVSPWNGFQPTVGDTFEILTAANGLVGEFANVVVDPSFTSSGIDFELIYSENSLVLSAIAAGLTGDFNGDGIVDTADYTLWRDTLGSEGIGLAADADRNGIVNAADYSLWRANFGATAGATVASTPGAVPEPTAVAMLGLAVVAAFATLRRRAA